MKAFIYLSVICAMVGLSIWFPQLMLNPGQLSQGHQKIEKKCTSCHKFFWGIDNARCISCHQPDQIDSGGKNPQLQFHANLNEQSCISCHTDHKGNDPSLTTTLFDHDIISSTLLVKCNSCHVTPGDSLHAQLTINCGSCHNTSKWKFSGNFDHGLIITNNRNNCSSCHQKPADDLHRYLENNCADCHSTSKWSPATFDHADYFILDNDHNVKCNTCHSSIDNLKIYTCYGCHEHSETNIAEEHEEEGIYNFDDCTSCHRSGDKHDIRQQHGVKNDQNLERIRKYVESEKKRKDGKEGHGDDD